VVVAVAVDVTMDADTSSRVTSFTDVLTDAVLLLLDKGALVPVIAAAPLEDGEAAASG
jgi:hypothetical protein